MSLSTVLKVKILLSTPNPQDHFLIVRLPEEALITIKFIDEVEPRDITPLSCDLALFGLDQNYRMELGIEVVPVEEFEVAKVQLLNATPDQVVCIYANPTSGLTQDVDWEEFTRLLSIGTAAQITAGVAHEAVEAPDTIESLGN